MYESPTSRWLLIRILLLQSHSILSHPPTVTPIYVDNLASHLDSRSMPLRHGSFHGAGVRMAFWAYRCLLTLALEPAQSSIYISTCADVSELSMLLSGRRTVISDQAYLSVRGSLVLLLSLQLAPSLTVRQVLNSHSPVGQQALCLCS